MDNYTVTLTVEDDACHSSDNTVIITVLNALPTAEAGPDQEVNEGDIVLFNGNAWDTPSDLPILTYAWDFDDGSTAAGSLTPSHIYGDNRVYNGDNGVYKVTLTVTDDDEGVGRDTLIVDVKNLPPAAGEINASLEPVNMSDEVSASVNFTDPGFLDTHTALWDWGDGETSDGLVTEENGSGNVTGSHTYSMPGVYTLKVTVTDDDLDSDYSILQYIVIYDPAGGFVTGGGWINSPEGAYAADPILIGKANFGFVSKYKQGASTPTGETEFNFKVASLNFHSDSYEWLVVAHARAQYKGIGKINGLGNYGFMLTAIDEALTPSTNKDLFRIKIWDRDNGDAVIYDNLMDAPDDTDPTTELGGGSIVIHKVN